LRYCFKQKSITEILEQLKHAYGNMSRLQVTQDQKSCRNTSNPFWFFSHSNYLIQSQYFMRYPTCQI